MTLIHNERVKLTANWIDRAATALVTVGVATPLAAYLFDIKGAGLTGLQTMIGAGVWLFFAVALHLAARHTLRGMRS